MLRRTTATTALALLCLALLGAGGALADSTPKPGGVLYVFRGPLKAANATSVAITVSAGNRAALAKMLGAPTDQTFATGEKTEYLRWSNGVPSVVKVADLKAGDWVGVRVRAAADADLAAIESTQAVIVNDLVAQPVRPDTPLYTFRGTISGASASSVAVKVAGGNRRALVLMQGQPADQAFAVDGKTVVLLWQGRVPTVVTASQLKTGDRVVVRVLADKGATLAQVAATPALRVGEHEPLAKSS